MQRRLMHEYLDSRIGMLNFTVPVTSIIERRRVAQQKKRVLIQIRSCGLDNGRDAEFV